MLYSVTFAGPLQIQNGWLRRWHVPLRRLRKIRAPQDLARKLLWRLRPFLSVAEHCQLVQSRPQDLVQMPIQLSKHALAQLQITHTRVSGQHLTFACAHSFRVKAAQAEHSQLSQAKPQDHVRMPSNSANMRLHNCRTPKVSHCQSPSWTLPRSIVLHQHLTYASALPTLHGDLHCQRDDVHECRHDWRKQARDCGPDGLHWA